MGLDIYFLASDKQPDEDELLLSGGRQIKFEVGYFRKVNALVSWVSTHIAKVENCQEIPITRQHLEQLCSTLSELTITNCAQLFPTAPGFFFGSTEYGEIYWSNVNDIRKWAHHLLNEFDFERLDLVFWAWW